jgi:hypothetical protein
MKSCALLFPMFALVMAIRCMAAQTQTSSNPEIPVSGPAVWKIAGVEYKIEGTAFLVMGNGQGLFIVKALCDFSPNASHRRFAESLARYAVAQELQKKAALVWNGKPLPFSGSIGVALMQQQSALIFTATSGHKYIFTVDELEKKKKG